MDPIMGNDPPVLGVGWLAQLHQGPARDLIAWLHNDLLSVESWTLHTLCFCGIFVEDFDTGIDMYIYIYM